MILHLFTADSPYIISRGKPNRSANIDRNCDTKQFSFLATGGRHSERAYQQKKEGRKGSKERLTSECDGEEGRGGEGANVRFIEATFSSTCSRSVRVVRRARCSTDRTQTRTARGYLTRLCESAIKRKSNHSWPINKSAQLNSRGESARRRWGLIRETRLILHRVFTPRLYASTDWHARRFTNSLSPGWYICTAMPARRDVLSIMARGFCVDAPRRAFCEFSRFSSGERSLICPSNSCLWKREEAEGERERVYNEKKKWLTKNYSHF